MEREKAKITFFPFSICKELFWGGGIFSQMDTNAGYGISSTSVGSDPTHSLCSFDFN